MNKRAPKVKHPREVHAATVAELRRMGAFNGGGTVEEGLRAELAARETIITILSPLARRSIKRDERSKEANDNKAKYANAKHVEWQRQAEAIWERKPSLSKKRVGELLAERGVGASAGTIRNNIGKPKK